MAGSETAPPAASSWRPIDLGTLPGGTTSWAVAINERGQIAGGSDDAGQEQHVVRWQRGRIVDLGLGSAQDINDRGDIVGSRRGPTGFTRAVLWRQGRATNLGTLGGAASAATAINNRGEIVGWSDTQNDVQHAFLWRRGQMIDLGVLAPGDSSYPTDINNHGVVVGNSISSDRQKVRPFIWRHGVMRPLPLPEGAFGGETFGINDRNEVILEVASSEEGPNLPYLLRHGSFVLLGDAPSEAAGRVASGLNNRTQVIGTHPGGFVWEKGRITTLPGLSEFSAFPRDINNRGLVVGLSEIDEFGEITHAVLWTR
jgi:probable HAF family extracellular repeat protein